MANRMVVRKNTTKSRTVAATSPRSRTSPQIVDAISSKATPSRTRTAISDNSRRRSMSVAWVDGFGKVPTMAAPTCLSGVFYLLKNNPGSAGNSYGCHENYLVARQGEFARIADVLIPFFVTRQIYAGAGKVLHGPRGPRSCLSQRAEHIWEGVSSATTRSRPIINTRDEPHADAERFRRLHVIVGDSNMSETTTTLKIGSTDLVRRMIESAAVMRDRTLEIPIRAIREISHDMTGRRKVKLANGREASALEI